MNKKLTVDNLISTFPNAMADDERLKAIASVTAQELLELYEDNDILAIYARIDDLDEYMLDILAYNFRVDWYDTLFDIDTKKQLIKNFAKVHRTKGSIYAVKTATNDIWESSVEEWFEYGGEPYNFRLNFLIKNKKLTDKIILKVLDRIKYYQNIRSKLESINIQIEINGTIYIGASAMLNQKIGVSERRYFVDEANNSLVDEIGNILYENV